MSKVQREIVGRAAMAVVAIALIWGGVKCFGVAADLKADVVLNPRKNSGAYLPFGIGVVLVVVGSPLLLGAVVPVGVMAKLLGRQTDVTLGTRFEGESTRFWINPFR